MITKNKKINKLTINLSGPQGNAFAILGLAKQIGRSLYEKEKVDEILTEMQSGDYRNLVLTFDRYFGDFVEIIDNDGVLDD